MKRTEFISKLTTRLGVGAGAIGNKALDGVRPLLGVDAIDIITFGSITVPEKKGNDGNTFFPGEGFTLNSIGLKNLGYAAYSECLKEIISAIKAAGKLAIVSVSGETPLENVQLARLAFDAGADGVEVNTACPNKWGEDGKQSSIAAFVPELVRDTLMAFAGFAQTYEGFADAIFGIKVAPYSNPQNLVDIANVINEFNFVTYVATMNTFPNAFMMNDGQNAISANAQGLAGLAGAAVLPIALGQVKQLRAVLREDIAIIGLGGISKGEHMKLFLDSGADAVQVVSAYYEKEKPEVFPYILTEYLDLVGEKVS